jgi:hypothetical protein
MTPQTTGFLATECPSCDGTGDIVVKRGLEQLPWRYDCDDCRSTGWVIHEDTPALSVPRLHAMLGEMERHVGEPGDEWFNNQLAGWNDALKTLGKWVQEDFEEAR